MNDMISRRMDRRRSTGWQRAMFLCVLAMVSLRCEDQVVAPESGDYLFLTEYIFSHENVLEGNQLYIPKIACAENVPPWFIFDSSAKSLRFYQVRSFPLGSKLESIVWLSGNDGIPPILGIGGCSWARPIAVDSLPVQVDSSVIFAGVEADGDANIVIGGRLVKLEVGSDYRTYLRTQYGQGYYRISPDTTRYRFAIEQVDSLQIHNYGWCPKRLVSFEGS
jgi:hypothetical protein